jgi:FKBP-type peptidyl-prolyl cis-trans isomerase FkpA
MRLWLLLPLAIALVSCSSKPDAETSKPDTGSSTSDSASFLDKAAAEPGAVKTPSGLVYRDLVVGTGPSPKASDMVTVNYRGTLMDGTEFDASAKHGGPTPLPLNQVIPCWTEGVQKMKVGGKAKLTCPGDIAYGPGGSPPVIPPNATLVFEIELVGIG